MELNTTSALVTAVISAGIGFGLAFYIERKISASMQKKSQKTLVALAMISFGYGLMATLNEVVGFPLQGLNIRYDKLVAYVLVNILILPVIFIAIAKFMATKGDVTTHEVNEKPKFIVGGYFKYFLVLVILCASAYYAYSSFKVDISKSAYDFYHWRFDERNCNSGTSSEPDYSLKFSHKKETNEIFVTGEFKVKGSIQSSIQKLDNCYIIDSNNWSCGGEWVANFLSPKYTFVNGEFSFTDGLSLSDKQPRCMPKIVKR